MELDREQFELGPASEQPCSIAGAVNFCDQEKLAMKCLLQNHKSAKTKQITNLNFLIAMLIHQLQLGGVSIFKGATIDEAKGTSSSPTIAVTLCLKNHPSNSPSKTPT